MKKIYKKAHLILVVAFVLMSAIASAQTPENYIQTLDGKKIICTGKVEMLARWVTYIDDKGKEQMIKHVDIKSMSVYGRTFVNFSLFKNGSMKRLHEIIAYNDKYLFTAFWQNDYFYYILDRSGNMIEERFRILGFQKRQKKAMEEKVSPYFNECKELINAMTVNVEAGKTSTEGISGYNCGSKEAKFE
jgi:hypothetical protein